MTKIVVLSDTHNAHMSIKDIPDGDILIHCGDATIYGSKNELDDFFAWFSWQPHKYKIFVPGNHDEGLYFPDQQPLFKDIQIPKEIIYLEGRYIEIEPSFGSRRLSIYGAPWRPRPEWVKEHKSGKFAAFGILKSKIKEAWDKIPKGLDILITHIPPLGALDELHGGAHMGCLELLKAVADKQPRYHVFGHMHCGYGMKIDHSLSNNPITFVNAALCDDLYDLSREPIVVEI